MKDCYPTMEQSRRKFLLNKQIDIKVKIKKRERKIAKGVVGQDGVYWLGDEKIKSALRNDETLSQLKAELQDVKNELTTNKDKKFYG